MRRVTNTLGELATNRKRVFLARAFGGSGVRPTYSVAKLDLASAADRHKEPALTILTLGVGGISQSVVVPQHRPRPWAVPRAEHVVSCFQVTSDENSGDDARMRLRRSYMRAGQQYSSFVRLKKHDNFVVPTTQTSLSQTSRANKKPI